MQHTVLCWPVSHVAKNLYWTDHYSYLIFVSRRLLLLLLHYTCIQEKKKNMSISNQIVKTLPAALKSGSKVFCTLLTDWYQWQWLAWIQPVIMESNGDPFSLWEKYHNHCWNQLLVTELKLTESCCSPSMRKLQTFFFFFLWPPFEAAGGVFLSTNGRFCVEYRFTIYEEFFVGQDVSVFNLSSLLSRPVKHLNAPGQAKRVDCYVFFPMCYCIHLTSQLWHPKHEVFMKMHQRLDQWGRRDSCSAVVEGLFPLRLLLMQIC